jgi:hypothetical protein
MRNNEGVLQPHPSALLFASGKIKAIQAQVDSLRLLDAAQIADMKSLEGASAG